jgi:hypothetical protein
MVRRRSPRKSHGSIRGCYFEHPDLIGQVFIDEEGNEAEDDKVVNPARVSTNAWPGSEAKIEILRKRVEDGESLWHEDDLTLWRIGDGSG